MTGVDASPPIVCVARPASHLSSWVSANTSDMLVKMPDSKAKLQLTLLRPLAPSTPVPASTARASTPIQAGSM